MPTHPDARHWPALLLLFGLFGCGGSGRSDVPVVRATYYWKSDFLANSNVQHLIDSARFQSVYLKFFEVDWNPRRAEALPLDRQGIDSYAWPDSGRRYEIIPTIFITNRALAHTDSAHVGQLAAKITRKLQAMLRKLSDQTLTLVPADSIDWRLQHQGTLERVDSCRVIEANT